ncbi:coiled-coil domain-containing protein 190 [Rhinoraja longicauda]
MQRVKSHALDGELTRRLDAERRESKRAETRLRNGLHDLEEARFSCINRMMKEQRRIQRDLLRIKNGYAKKKAANNYQRLCPDPNYPSKETIGFNNKLLPIRLTAKDGSFILASEGIRGQKESVKMSRIVVPASISRALQSRINDFLGGLGGRQEAVEERAGAEEVRALTAPTAGHPKSGAAPTGPKPSLAKTSPRGGNQTASESGDVGPAHGDATSCHPSPSQVKTRQPHGSLQPLTSVESPPDEGDIYAPDGLPRTVHTMPSFHEAFAEARKARYIRHRSRPEEERELTISEIFERCPGPLQHASGQEGGTVMDKNPTGKH